MKLGVTGLFLSIKCKEVEYAQYVDKFSYSHAEDEDDSCTFTLSVKDINIVDDPAFKTNTEWVVAWGYSQDKTLQHREKIYIEDVGIDISDKGININIIGHDKASIYRKYTSKATHENTTLPGYLAKKGQEVGIKTFIEVPLSTPWDKNAKVGNIPQVPSKLLLPSKKDDLQMKMIRDRQTQQIEVYPGIYRNEGENRPTPEKIAAIKATARKQVEGGEDPNRTALKIYYQDRFYKTQSIVEGNKTTKQVAKKLAATDPNGPYVIEGHSDIVIIKKRNVNVKPMYRYEYGVYPNELISFKPSMRKRSIDEDKPKSFQGSHFDPINKKFSQGPYIKPQAEVRVEQPFKLTSGETFNLTTGQSGGVTSGMREDFKNTTKAVRDATAAPIKSIQYQKVPIVQETYVDVDGVARLRDGIKVGESFNTQEQAMANAANKQTLTEQEDSPGSAVFLGNPNILSGVAVYIGNVSKKFSSNYYITKATHDIDSSGGYKVSCDILKSTISTGKDLPMSESIPTATSNNSKKVPNKIKNN